jgi:hypothetical protein
MIKQLFNLIPKTYRFAALIVLCAIHFAFTPSESEVIVFHCTPEISIDTKGLVYEVTQNDTDDLFYFIGLKANAPSADLGYFMVSCSTGTSQFHCCSGKEYRVGQTREGKNYTDRSGTIIDSNRHWRALSFNGGITIIYDDVPADRLEIANDIIDQVFKQMVN